MSLTRPSLARLAVPAATAIAGLALLSPVADAAKKKKVTSYTVKSGTTMLTLDPSLAPLLTQKNVTVTPIAPATLQGTDTITLPISGGKVDLKKGTLTLKHKGGLTLGGAGLPLSVEVKNAIINATKSTSALTADTTLGSGMQLLKITGIKAPKKVSGKRLSLVGSSVFVDSLGNTLRTFVPELPAGPVPFGTITIDAKLK
jgi:hypothetical protein